jgi:hypothetical protein
MYSGEQLQFHRCKCVRVCHDRHSTFLERAFLCTLYKRRYGHKLILPIFASYRRVALTAGSNSFSNNYFGNNGTGGLRIASNASVSGNTFFQNRWEMSDQEGGGQLYLESGLSGATVFQNTFDGNSWATGSSNINNCCPPSTVQYASGIEVEPGSSSNSLLGNEIHHQSAEGIDANGVTSLTISGYYPSSPSNPKYIHDNGGRRDQCSKYF